MSQLLTTATTAAADSTAATSSLADARLWWLTIGTVLALFVFDLLLNLINVQAFNLHVALLNAVADLGFVDVDLDVVALYGHAFRPNWPCIRRQNRRNWM